MKNKILKIFLSILTLSSIYINISNVSAFSGDIPEIMQPKTIIEYISNDEFEIINGGFLSPDKLQEEKNKLKENQIVSQKFLKEKFPDQIIDETNVITEEITPVKGMKITYGDNCLIFDVEYPNGVENPLLKENNKQLRGDFLPDGVSLLRQWGTTPNKLYIDRKNDTIIGIGTATTFNDYIGQANHVLEKGDIATKLSFDNCQLGLDVYVTAKKSNGSSYTKVMKKWDAGGMPNAIVDIWKDGVQFWDYTYYEQLSLNGSTTIEHDNLNVNGGKLY